MHFDNMRRVRLWVGGEAMQSWGMGVRLSARASEYLHSRHPTQAALNLLSRDAEEVFALFGGSIDRALTSLVGSEWSAKPEVLAACMSESASALYAHMLAEASGTRWFSPGELVAEGWRVSLATGYGDHGPSATLTLSLGGGIGYEEMNQIRRSMLMSNLSRSLSIYLCAFDLLFTASTLPQQVKDSFGKAFAGNLGVLRLKLGGI